jgi:hypothetical protein
MVTTFEARLAGWNRLRHQVADMSVYAALVTINAWWFRAPWCAYHLHWDDQHNWPDPWQLLEDNLFCEVARGLGILYTITLLNRPDIADAELVLTKDDRNLVLVGQSKYILNWNEEVVVNSSQPVEIIKRVHQSGLASQYK